MRLDGFNALRAPTPSPQGGGGPASTHVTFPRPLGLLIKREAEARNLSVTAFVQLAMTALLAEPQLLGAIDDAASYIGQSRDMLRGADGMTQNQRAILFLAASHAGLDGRCVMGPRGFASLTAMDRNAAMLAMQRLQSSGLLRLTRERPLGMVLWVELTPDGWAASRALTGVVLDGGEA